MVAKGVPLTSLSGLRSHGCGCSERACLSLGTPKLSLSLGEPQRTGGSRTMHNTHIDWSAVVTALAVMSIITFLFLH
jgi:hypothetical protein